MKKINIKVANEYKVIDINIIKITANNSSKIMSATPGASEQ